MEVMETMSALWRGYPEAQSFAEEALTEANLPLNTIAETENARLSSLSQEVIQHATQLLKLTRFSEQEKVEALFSQLCCMLSEFRHLRSPVAELPAEPCGTQSEAPKI